MNQPTRLGPRKTVQLLIALTILAWATQTLIAQWGFGQTTQPKASAAGGAIVVGSVVSHDLQAPLRNRMLLDLLGADEPLGPGTDEIVARARRNPPRMSALVDSLLGGHGHAAEPGCTLPGDPTLLRQLVQHLVAALATNSSAM